MKEIWFNGIKFTKDDKTGYYLNSSIRKRLHRYVWELHYGEIPEGYHIHHIDFDKSNIIRNLCFAVLSYEYKRNDLKSHKNT